MIINEIKLNIIYRFKDYEYLVFCSDNSFYQLQHLSNKRTKPMRKLDKKLIGGSICLLINRKPVPLARLRKLAVKTFEFVKIGEEILIPF